MPPLLRDSGGPEGRQKTSLPPPGFPKPSRQEAGVEIACMNYRVRAAGRGVDAPCLITRLCEPPLNGSGGSVLSVLNSMQIRSMPQSRTDRGAA